MKHKFYFESPSDEICYSLDYFVEKLEVGEDELILFPAIPETCAGVFWCKIHHFCGDDSRDTCGRQCKEYEPRNGKSGRCRHHCHWVYEHGDPIRIDLKTAKW